jgi:hypothetical protein
MPIKLQTRDVFGMLYHVTAICIGVGLRVGRSRVEQPTYQTNAIVHHVYTPCMLYTNWVATG